MSKKAILFAALFVLAHIALLAPFVPLVSLVPTVLGVLSMSAMALTLVLAARWRFVDHLMGGPDKSYGAHRWLGFFALGGAMGHWALASAIDGGATLAMLGDSGEGAGTVAAFGLIGMSAAAVVRAIPYHVWKVSHMLMGPVFALSAYHTFFVGSPFALGTAPWLFMALICLIGLAAWLQTLLRKAVPARLVQVERAVPFDGGIDITLRADTKLPSFRPGQFATLAHTCARAEAHPFTIAGGDATSRRFVIRAAGDWTRDFVAKVRTGDELRLGRAVGRFLPQLGPKRSEQLWVAGGVGITPFLAALERMGPDDAAPITLIYCVRSRQSAGAIEDVERHAARLPQVNLLILGDKGHERLTQAKLAGIIANMAPKAEVYLCGPEGLKTLVTTAWQAAGMRGRIHTERFDFRGAYAISDLIAMGKPVLNFAQDWIAAKKAARGASVRS